jgi:hypothetical protein
MTQHCLLPGTHLQQVAEADGCVGGPAVRAGAACSERSLKPPGEALPLLRCQLIVVTAGCEESRERWLLCLILIVLGLCAS